jgi:hypothetical protein
MDAPHGPDNLYIVVLNLARLQGHSDFPRIMCTYNTLRLTDCTYPVVRGIYQVLYHLAIKGCVDVIARSPFYQVLP